MRPRARGEGLRDRLARLRAAGVHDAAPGVAALLPEVVVELDAELDEIGDPRRRLVAERPYRALPAEAAPGSQRVLGVQLRVVSVADRGGDPALREVAVRGEHRPAREQ